MKSDSAPEDPLVDAFLEYLEVERNASPRTVAAYRAALEFFRSRPGLLEWKDWAADHFRSHLFQCMKEEKARSYIRLHFAALRSFYRFLVERQRLKQNPLKQVHLPKLEKKLPVVL